MYSLIEKTGRLFRTLARLSFRQLSSRAVRVFKYKLIFPILGPVLYPLPASKAVPDPHLAGKFEKIPNPGSLRHRSQAEIADQIRLADEILFGQVDLLNQTTQFPDDLDWGFSSGGDPLWAYTLHYFEWADPLLVAYKHTKDPKYPDRWLALAQDWITENSPGKSPGWDPYPTSRRIMAWLKAFALLSSSSGESVPGRHIQSLLQQGQFLAENFEYDLLNNHLIANAAALAWLGTVYEGWKGSSNWQKKGYTVLWSEFLRQVNEEGFQAERSPSYQRIVQQDVADTAQLAKNYGIPVPVPVAELLYKMDLAQEILRRPDGHFPLLHDAVRGYPAQDPGYRTGFLTKAQSGQVWPDLNNGSIVQPSNPESKSRIFPDSGLAVFRAGEGDAEDYLVFDFGPHGPKWNPGHGHAGALGFELFAAGMPLIIDPGTYSYHQQPWRNYFRSSSSHNTLVVDGLDQSEIWGSFRVGRMAAVRLLDWDLSGPQQFASAEQDGYRRLSSPVTHSRKVVYQGPRRWNVIDQVEGSGFHVYEIYFHFPPGAAIHPVGASEYQIDYGADWRLKIMAEHTLECEGFIESGWVSETWNQKQEAPVLCFRSEGYPTASWEFELWVE